MRGQLQWMGILALFFLLSCGSKKDAYFPDDTNDPNKEAKAFFNKRHNNGMNDPNSIYGVWKKMWKQVWVREKRSSERYRFFRSNVFSS